MKRIVALLCALSFHAAAQTPKPRPLDPVTHRLAYTGDVAVPGARRAPLLDRATAWSVSRDVGFRPAVVTAPRGVPRVGRG